MARVRIRSWVGQVPTKVDIQGCVCMCVCVMSLSGPLTKLFIRCLAATRYFIILTKGSFTEAR